MGSERFLKRFLKDIVSEVKVKVKVNVDILSGATKQHCESAKSTGMNAFLCQGPLWQNIDSIHKVL